MREFTGKWFNIAESGDAGQVTSVPESKLHTLSETFPHISYAIFRKSCRATFKDHLKRRRPLPLQVNRATVPLPGQRPPSGKFLVSPLTVLRLFPKTTRRGFWKMSAKSRHPPALHFRERTNSYSMGSDGLWLLTSNLALMSPSTVFSSKIPVWPFLSCAVLSPSKAPSCEAHALRHPHG